MKTLYAVVILFVASLLGVAVWFSPLCDIGTPTAYVDNMPISALDGLCYPSDALCRVDFSGSEKDMARALGSIFAVTVKKVKTDDGLTVVYAFSPRVCAPSQYLRSGEEYNVMAAYNSGNISVGTPILSGCY
ncbi:MAG: hypothetical protein K2F90_00930 [Clostridiales bacterium]|nr:hypothetical protein [Clostridiales bacterium]